MYPKGGQGLGGSFDIAKNEPTRVEEEAIFGSSIG